MSITLHPNFKREMRDHDTALRNIISSAHISMDSHAAQYRDESYAIAIEKGGEEMFFIDETSCTDNLCGATQFTDWELANETLQWLLKKGLFAKIKPLDITIFA